MGNTNNKTYSEVIQDNGSEINRNKLIRPEYIGELEVDCNKYNYNKYNYIIDINNTIKKILSFFEESYNTKEIPQTSYNKTNTTWKQPLYDEWKDLITKEVNIYKPEFTGNYETEFTNQVMNKGGITFRILGKILLPILINIIINKDKFRASNMLYRNLLYNSDLYSTIKTNYITLLDKTATITIKDLLETKDRNNNNEYQYDIYDIIKYIYIYIIISKKTSEQFKDLSYILNNESANGGKFQRGKSKRGKSKKGKSKRGKSKKGKTKRDKSKRGKSKRDKSKKKY